MTSDLSFLNLIFEFYISTTTFSNLIYFLTFTVRKAYSYMCKKG